MHILTCIDGYLLSLVEIGVHFVQRYFGKSIEWLTWLILFLSTLLAIVMAWLQIETAKNELFVDAILAQLFFVTLAVCLNFIVIPAGINFLKKIFPRNEAFRNPLAVHPAFIFLRLFNVCEALSQIIFLVIVFENGGIETIERVLLVSNRLLLTLLWYIVACTPLPPNESKSRDLFSVFRNALSGPKKLQPSH